jgi:hypothetical protein
MRSYIDFEVREAAHFGPEDSESGFIPRAILIDLSSEIRKSGILWFWNSRQVTNSNRHPDRAEKHLVETHLPYWSTFTGGHRPRATISR